MLDELAELLRGAARGLYPHFKYRLTHLKHISSEIGWGFGDHVQEVVDELQEDLGASA